MITRKITQFVAGVSLIVLSLNVNAQTEQETKDWIRHKIEKYGRTEAIYKPQSKAATEVSIKYQTFYHGGDTIKIQETRVLKDGTKITNIYTFYIGDLTDVTNLGGSMDVFDFKTYNNKVILQEINSKTKQPETPFYTNHVRTKIWFVPGKELVKEDNIEQRFLKASKFIAGINNAKPRTENKEPF
jgi:hypothetical protein